MKDKLDKIEKLEDENVIITFSDGCIMNIKIISTMHIRDGNDFVGDVLEINCSKDHWHPAIGQAININVADIIKIKKV